MWLTFLRMIFRKHVATYKHLRYNLSSTKTQGDLLKLYDREKTNCSGEVNFGVFPTKEMVTSQKQFIILFLLCSRLKC